MKFRPFCLSRREYFSCIVTCLNFKYLDSHSRPVLSNTNVMKATNVSYMCNLKFSSRVLKEVKGTGGIPLIICYI